MEQCNTTPWIVRLEFQRIQTFLFAVPRLRAMLGANAMLGHAIRAELPGLTGTSGCEALQLTWLGTPPTAVQGDPLAAEDAPAVALRQGILSRDGGHLRIAFKDDVQAKNFIAEAQRYLSLHLPDLLVSLEPFPAGSKPSPRGALESSRVTHLAELPQFQVCTRSGFGVASEEANPGKPDVAYVSAATKSKEEKGKAFQAGAEGSRDYITLLRGHLPRYECLIPEDLERLSDTGGYIALIHADGNRVGKRIKAYEKAAEAILGEPQWLAKECAIETFFHRMRGVVRASLIEALTAVFTQEVLAEHEYLPYQLLMLGGDDLLLLCHPGYALRFVQHYAKALADSDRHLVDGESLSIGAGVVIAKHSLPFHRLHQLAEALAGSAKRAFLQVPSGMDKDKPPQRSTVDWAVLTSSWGEDPLEHRRRQELIGYEAAGKSIALALTAKPYFILDSAAALGGLKAPSLEGLLQMAETLETADELPRSQLKGFLRDLEGGLGWSNLAYREVLARLSEGARSALVALAPSSESPWTQVSSDEKSMTAFTQLKDLIECLELRYLGRRKQEQRDE